MIRLGADENVPGDVLRGLGRRVPELDLVRVHDAGLRGATDERILEWAAEESRVVVTADRATMIEYAHERVREGRAMPGLIVLGRRVSVGKTIEDLVLAVTTTQPGEWTDQVVYLPL